VPFLNFSTAKNAVAIIQFIGFFAAGALTLFYTARFSLRCHASAQYFAAVEAKGHVGGVGGAAAATGYSICRWFGRHEGIVPNLDPKLKQAGPAMTIFG
jgi:hypothetical protein